MSTRSGGPSSSARPSARTSIRVLRIPCSIRNERTASARDNERRRAELRVSTVPPAYAFNCRRPSLSIMVTARDPNLRSASGVSRVLAPRKSMRRICPPSGGNGTGGSAATRRSVRLGCTAGGDDLGCTTALRTGARSALAGGAFGVGGGASATGDSGAANFGTLAGGVGPGAICRDATALAETGPAALGAGGGAFGTGLDAGAAARTGGWTARCVTFGRGKAGIGPTACRTARGRGAETGRCKVGRDAAGVEESPTTEPGKRSRTASVPCSPGMRSRRPVLENWPRGRSSASRFTSTAGLPPPPMTTVDCARDSAVSHEESISAPNMVAVERNLVHWAVCADDTQNDMT